MLDLSKQMEVSYKVNQMIKKANDTLDLGLHQPSITYKLKRAGKVAEVSGRTINFNSALTNIITADIQDQVAHLINFQLNREIDAKSVTYQNIMKVLDGKLDIVTDIKPKAEAPKKVVTAKTVKPKANKPKAKTGERKAQAIAVLEANPGLTRQEMLTKLVEAFGFSTDKPGRIKAAGLYQQAKKALEK